MQPGRNNFPPTCGAVLGGALAAVLGPDDLTLYQHFLLAATGGIVGAAIGSLLKLVIERRPKDSV